MHCDDGSDLLLQEEISKEISQPKEWLHHKNLYLCLTRTQVRLILPALKWRYHHQMKFRMLLQRPIFQQPLRGFHEDKQVYLCLKFLFQAERLIQGEIGKNQTGSISNVTDLFY